MPSCEARNGLLWRKFIFIAFKIFEKIYRNSIDIYILHIGVSTHGHVQNIGQTPPKPFPPISIFWNISIRNILIKFLKNSSMSPMICLMILPSFIIIQVDLAPLITLKPYLCRIKFEQLYIVKCLQLCSTLVDMLEYSNKASTPSGTPRRIEELVLRHSIPSLVISDFS